MQQRTHQILFSLHSWAGIVTGLLMFIVCFSGAVVVFKHEIDLWANPSLAALPRAEKPASIDSVFKSALEYSPKGQVESIWLPDEVNPNYFVFIREGKTDRYKLAARADTGEVVGKVDSQLGQYIRSLHVFLFFGPRWIVGFLGVAMLVLIGTGIFIHTKIIKELFTQRWRRSFRLVTSDLHKSAGIWGLAFHILIAFTGAWLGLAPVFERGFEFAMNPQKVAAKPKVTPKPAEMVSLDSLLARAKQDIPDFRPRFVSLANWGRSDAQASLSGGIENHLASTARLRYAGTDGTLKDRHDPREKGFWSQVNSLMEPLHFGDFGGIWLKVLYFLLGMSPAALSLTGTLIWLDRRKQLRRSVTVPSNAVMPLPETGRA